MLHLRRYHHCHFLYTKVHESLTHRYQQVPFVGGNIFCELTGRELQPMIGVKDC